ncbi:hypothetical protein TWF694_010033 [Orbilia ellipsospora]|uniref:Uncharacterized protein n=1 Tax=Orbilia ellipsospora TaxID=2528407 RepID=A0AAV9X8P0_9PEZI
MTKGVMRHFSVEVIVGITQEQPLGGHLGGTVVVDGGFLWQQQGMSTSSMISGHGPSGVAHLMSGQPMNPVVTVVEAGQLGQADVVGGGVVVAHLSTTVVVEGVGHGQALFGQDGDRVVVDGGLV